MTIGKTYDSRNFLGKIQDFRITKNVALYGDTKACKAIINMLSGTVILENKLGQCLGIKNYQGCVSSLIWRLTKLNVKGHNSEIEFRWG